MKEYTDILDRIERYSKGKMPLDEKLVFEKELATDVSLREQLEYSQIVDQMIVGAEALKLKEQMQKDLNKPKFSKYLAASILVLLASAGLYMVFNKKEDKTPVATPASVAPKTMKQAVKEVAVQQSASPIATKTATSQEKKTSVKAQPATPEFKVASVQPEMVQNISVPTSAPAFAAPSVASKQNVPVAAKVDPCADLVGEVEFYTVATCAGDASGEVYIKVESVKGGSAPFVFKLGERSAKSRFEQLPAGQYALLIKDAKGCEVENVKKVMIGEKQCKKNKEYVFNPEYDPTWTIPYNKEKEASNFKIVDKSGKLFYQTSVSAHQPSEWNGESNTGTTLGMGLYFITIEYADGSVDEGSIMVTR